MTANGRRSSLADCSTPVGDSTPHPSGERARERATGRQRTPTRSRPTTACRTNLYIRSSTTPKSTWTVRSTRNALENLWSLLKRSLKGTYEGVGAVLAVAQESGTDVLSHLTNGHVSAKKSNDFFDAPHMIRDASLHRRPYAHGLVNQWRRRLATTVYMAMRLGEPRIRERSLDSCASESSNLLFHPREPHIDRTSRAAAAPSSDVFARVSSMIRRSCLFLWITPRT